MHAKQGQVPSRGMVLHVSDAIPNLGRERHGGRDGSWLNESEVLVCDPVPLDKEKRGAGTMK